MEESTEKRVWQRVKGEPEAVQRLRRMLEEQGRLWGAYRCLGRRGGKFRLLLEQKENQIACLRGMLRVQTGQSAAHPRPGGETDLLACFGREQRLMEELTALGREPDLGPVFTALAEGQRRQLRILLEVIGTM